MLKKRTSILLWLASPLVIALMLALALRSPMAHAAPLAEAREQSSPSGRGGDLPDDQTAVPSAVAPARAAALQASGAITVNTAVDEFGSGGDCALREAIESANQDSDFGGCLRVGVAPYQIDLPAATYTLAITGTSENANATGDLDILTDVMIVGEGADNSIIDGGGIDRVFDIVSNAVSFDSLTITHGNIISGGGQTGSGGGIRIQLGTTAVTVTNSSVVSNTSSFGGGIRNYGSILTIINSSVSNNVSDAYNGGGIRSTNGSSVYIYSSLLDSNQSTEGGGGIYGDGAVVTIVDSTISNNHTDDWGGGIFIDDNDVLTVTNSTISGNTATIGAGAISDNCNIPAMINIINSTITNNGTPTTWSGGGMDMCSSTPTFNNTILAGNYNGSGPSDFYGVAGVVSQGHNLESGTDAGFTQTTDLQNTDPLLLPLANNGGATMTHALQPGSPAIDAGDCTTAPAADQRGVARPQGAGCDMGAYELWDVDIAIASSTELELMWDAAAMGCVYDVYEDTMPYAEPITADYYNQSSGVVYPNVGDPMMNYFYIVKAVCDEAVTAVSNEIGEFDYAIVPGS